MKLACQAYTWQMTADKWVGKVPEILDVVARCGYAGYESEHWFLGEYGQDAEKLRRELDRRKLTLVSLGVVGCWTDQRKWDQEFAKAKSVVEFLTAFPAPLLLIAGGTVENRDNIDAKFDRLIESLERVASFAGSRGVKAGFHPHSHHGSIFASEDDYDRLLSKLDFALVGFVPDAGHIARTGVAPVPLFERSADKIVLVHFKDYDGKQWVPMGTGTIDYPGIVRVLREKGYAGWLIVEDESRQSVDNPENVIRANRQYVKTLGV